MNRKFMIENKKDLISSIVIFICVFTSNIYAGFSTYVVKFDDGSKSRLNLTNLNNIDYISINDLARGIFKSAKIDKPNSELSFNNNTFKFSPLSFYVKYSSKSENRIIQFRRPCISYANNLLIPFNSMLIALEVLQIYSPQIEKNILYMNKYRQAKSPNQINAKSVNNIQDSDSSIDESTDQNQNSNYYSFNVVDDKDSDKAKAINKELKTTKNDNNNHGINVQAAIIKNETPNNYIIPNNLKRKLGENIVYDETKTNPNNIFASNTKQTKSDSNSTNIIKMYAEYRSNQIFIHLSANSIIEQYQKPEFEANKITIRIPNVIDKISDYSMVLNSGLIKSVTPEKIRNYQIYHIIINDDIIECGSRRNGPKELIFTITTQHKIKVGKINNEHVVNQSEMEVKPNVRQEKPAIQQDKVPPQHKIKNKVKNDFSNEKKKWDLDCIVLDPGHGGKDAGAVSISGIYEKDITLKIAKKVKELLKDKMPNTRVVMTRNDDRFIELYRRGQIANNAHGKLFISIHLNSARKKPSKANGFETYILRPGKNKDAIRVANFENSAIKFETKSRKYKTLTDEELIIATMAQSSFVKFSELFARLIQNQVVKTTNLQNRGVKQAGFYVLIGASMPNVLFEAGFLSNKKDEKYVSSDVGISQIANGIVNAIIQYAEEYKKY